MGKVITGIDTAEARGGVKVFHAGTKFENLQLLSAGGRVLGVTATAEDLPSAIERAYTAVGKINFEGMHYRHDIGAKGLRRLSREPANQLPGRARGRVAGPAGGVLTFGLQASKADRVEEDSDV